MPRENGLAYYSPKSFIKWGPAYRRGGLFGFGFGQEGGFGHRPHRPVHHHHGGYPGVLVIKSFFFDADVAPQQLSE